MDNLTPELLAQMKAEQAETEIFSFDVEKFKTQVADGDMTTMVIRAHLYLEHVLIQTLLEEFKVRDAFNLRRISFPQKLDLCISLGLLPRDWRRSVIIINEMRNDVAHQLDFVFGKEILQELWDTMPPFLHGIIANHAAVRVEEARDKAQFHHLFRALILFLDLARREALRARIHRKYAAINIDLLLKELDERDRKPMQQAGEAEASIAGSGVSTMLVRPSATE